MEVKNMAYAGPTFDFYNLNTSWLDEWRKENADRENKTAKAYDRIYDSMRQMGEAAKYAREEGYKKEDRELQKEYMQKRMDMLTKGYEEYLKGLEDPTEAERRRKMMIGINPNLFGIYQSKWGSF